MNVDLYLSSLSYKVEDYMGAREAKTIKFKEGNKSTQDFETYLGQEIPNNIELIGAHHDAATGTTVVMCRDTNTGDILASCTGTNFGSGAAELAKDVWNWEDIANFGMNPYGQEVTSILNFFDEMGVYPNRVSGHSLGGCLAQIVGLRLNIDIEVFNSAPLYTILSNLLFQTKLGPEFRYVNLYETWKPLIDNYTGNAVDYVAGKDIMTATNKITGGKVIGKVIFVDQNELQLALIPHFLDNFSNHESFIGNEHKAYRAQGIDKFEVNGVVNIDINNDDIVDITRTTNDYQRRELFNLPENWSVPQYIPSYISINPELLNNLATSVKCLSDEFLTQELTILNIIDDKNQIIASQKDIRITFSGDEIKNTIQQDYLNNSIDRIKVILDNDITVGNFGLGDVEDIINKNLGRNDINETEKQYLYDLRTICTNITAEYKELIKSRDRAISDITSFNQKLDKVYANLNDTLAQQDSQIPNTFDDYICSVFAQLVSYLKDDINHIKLFLDCSGEMITYISDNFENKDSEEAKHILDGMIKPLEPSYIDVVQFNKLGDHAASPSNPYIDFYNIDANFEQQVNNALSKFNVNYLAPLETALIKLSKELMWLDEYIHVDRLINHFMDVINTPYYCGQTNSNTTINAKFFRGDFTTFNAYNMIASNAFHSLCTLENNLKNYEYDYLCHLAHQVNICLANEGLLNYLWNMIMELFYKKYDFDEQVATFNILCYDLIRLKQDVQTVINHLRTQSSEALSKLADIFQEVVDYCTVFVTRIEMIFDNRTITTQKDLGDVGDYSWGGPQ